MAGQTPPRDPFGPTGQMGRWDDPELAEIFRDEPELYELSRSLRAARPDPVVGPHFQPYLRARLMDVAARELRPRGLSRWLRPRPGVFAGGGAALGVAMIAAVVVTTVMYHPNDTRVVTVGANVAENHSVDPHDVIRVSFSEPVDHGAVEHNLQIRPATSVQTHWEGTTLVITPLHHLAANTPYTVTIPRSAVVDSRGRTAAAADIHIAFGTAATPTPGPTALPAQPPTLQPQQLGAVTGDSRVLIGPDGTVLATSAIQSPPAGSSPTPGLPLVTGLPSPTGLLSSHLPGHSRATPTPLPSATASASSSGQPSTALTDLDTGGGPTVLGPTATVAAFSPSGRSLAYLVAGGDTASLVVAGADGSNPHVLTRGADATSPLAWSGEDTLLFLSSGEQVSSVDLQGRVRSVGELRIGEGQDLALAPGGGVVYLGPQASALPSASPSGDVAGSPSPGETATPTPSPEDVGHLVDLSTGNLIPLQGIRQLPAFSGDGSTVAWIDESGTVPVLDVMPVASGSSPTTVPTAAAAGDTLGNLALNGDGTRIAYTLAHAGGSGAPALTVASVGSGETLASGDGLPVESPVLSQGGDRIAFLRPTGDGLVAATAVIPGTTPPSPAADAVPAEAATLVDQFVAAQLAGDKSTLRNLGAPSLTVNDTLTPHHVTRTYVIKEALDTASQTVTAEVRLVRDATASQAVSSADETLKLARPAAGQPFQVTVAAISDFQGEPAGPQVVHVTTGREQGALVVRIAFDSDLDPATVIGAVVTLSAAGVALPADVSYDVANRTILLHAVGVHLGTLALSVSDALHDVAGGALAGGYTTTVQG